MDYLNNFKYKIQIDAGKWTSIKENWLSKHIGRCKRLLPSGSAADLENDKYFRIFLFGENAVVWWKYSQDCEYNYFNIQFKYEEDMIMFLLSV